MPFLTYVEYNLSEKFESLLKFAQLAEIERNTTYKAQLASSLSLLSKRLVTSVVHSAALRNLIKRYDVHCIPFLQDTLKLSFRWKQLYIVFKTLSHASDGFTRELKGIGFLCL